MLPMFSTPASVPSSPPSRHTLTHVSKKYLPKNVLLEFFASQAPNILTEDVKVF